MDGFGALSSPKLQAPTSDFPATEVQKRLWREWQGGLHLEDALCAVFRWRVSGPLTPELAREALHGLLLRHEILRTRFADGASGLRQVVADDGVPPLQSEDFSSAEDPVAACEQACQQDARRSFAPGEQLWRVSLFTQSSDTALLQLRLHNLLADGWSVGILIEDFAQLLQAAEAQGAMQLPEVELHYGDFACYQEALLADRGGLEAERTHWALALRGATPLSLPADHQKPAQRSGASILRSQLLPRELTDRLAERSRLQGGTLFSIVAAGWAATLARLTGAADLVLGAHSACRDDPGLDRVVGPVYNALPLRFDTNPASNLADFSRHVADVVRRALSNQRLPYERAVALAGLPHGSEQDLLRVNFTLQKGFTASVEGKAYGPFRFTPIPSPASPPLYALQAFVIERQEGWRASIEADGDLFEPLSIDGIMQLWLSCLNHLAGEDTITIGALPTPEALVHLAPKARSGETKPRPPSAKIIALQPMGRRPPIFVFNGQGIYHALASELGNEQPLLASVLYDPAKPVPYKVRPFEELASEHVRSIRLRQPKGPYFLGGFCVSGCLAYEAARQLRDLGEEVGFVAIFDAWAPGFIVSRPPIERALIRAAVRAGNRIRQIERLFKKELSLSQVLQTIALLRKTGLLDYLHRHGLPRDPPEVDPFGTPWYLDKFNEAKMAYKPKSLDVDVLLFASQDYNVPLLAPYKLGWSSLVQPLEVIPTPGGHFSLLQGMGAQLIAGRLTQAIGRVMESRRCAK